MEIRADQVAVRSKHGAILPSTTLRIKSGMVLLAAGQTALNRTALALTMAGRLKPTSGELLIDGERKLSKLRRHVSLVDVPGVSSPEDNMPLCEAVAEELCLARRASGRKQVAAWLAARGVEELAKARVDALDGETRTRLFTELAAARPHTEGLILDSPDRLATQPVDWYRIARHWSGRGLWVLVIVPPTVSAVVPAPSVHIGPELTASQQRPAVLALEDEQSTLLPAPKRPVATPGYPGPIDDHRPVIDLSLFTTRQTVPDSEETAAGQSRFTSRIRLNTKERP
ncbi:hypothetical protein D5S17_14285 [Pseudonocardiaceae bacterium YIM PH 21723]|nr:hypothetical protein D5S17_14285 [Pseudonocardiaceae bacterium YIM PH 21723]